MPDNLVGTLLTSLVRAAAVTVVGPAGLVVAPALATVCIWAGEQLGEGTRPFAESLTHVFGHLAGDKAKEAFSSLRETGNHDLERMAAVAFRAALDAIHIRIGSAGGLLTADYDRWFLLWRARLDRAIRSGDAASLFHAGEADPVAIETAGEDKWWPLFQPVLLRWADEQREFENDHSAPGSLPPDLAKTLADELLGLSRQAIREVLREGEYQRSWIAWQQSFLAAIARETRQTNADLARRLDELSGRTNEIRRYLNDEIERLHLRLDRVDENLAQIRAAIAELHGTAALRIPSYPWTPGLPPGAMLRAEYAVVPFFGRI